MKTINIALGVTSLIIGYVVLYGIQLDAVAVSTAFFTLAVYALVDAQNV